jgi:hypothetical protein
MTLPAVHLPHASDVGCEMPLLHELGDNGLVECWGSPIDEIAGCRKRRKQSTRHNRVTEAQTREALLRVPT